MNVRLPDIDLDRDRELSLLIETLRRTQERIVELTEGQIDAVSDREGRTILLGGAQQQLRDADAAKQAAILDALPAHVALLDADGMIVSVNDAWTRFEQSNPGPSQAPIHTVGVNYLEVCDRAQGPDCAEAPLVAAGIRAVLEGRARSYSIEYPCHSPDQQRWFLMTVNPVIGSRRMGVVAMHVDISARKLSEEALQRFRAAMDETAEAIVLVSRASMRYVEFNATACRMFGYTREELLQMGPWQMMDQCSRDDLARAYDSVIAGRAADRLVESWMRRKDGSRIRVEVRRHVQRSGSDWLIVGVVSEVTARRRAEESLRDSELRFRQLAENIDDVFFLLEADMSRFLYLSPACEKVIGRSCESLYADRALWSAIMHPDDRANVVAAFERDIPGGKFEYEFRIVRPDDAVRWLQVRAFLARNEAGIAVRVAGVAKDITEQKIAEDVVRKRAVELERFHRLSVGREMQMIELKKLINQMARQAGATAPFDLAFLEPHTTRGSGAHVRTA